MRLFRTWSYHENPATNSRGTGKYRGTVGISLALALVATVPATASAGYFAGSIHGYFENPVLKGVVDRVTGPQFFDNTNSAVYSINNYNPSVPNASGASLFFYGITGGGVSTGSPGGSSSFQFLGNQNVSVNSDDPFDIGTFWFFNSNNSFESLVFGVDLVLKFTSTSGDPVDPYRIKIKITTTENSEGLPGADIARFSNPAVNVKAAELFGIAVNIRGAIIGDPYFDIQSVTLSGDHLIRLTLDDPNTPENEYKYEDLTFPPGTNLPTYLIGRVEAVPEPSSLLLMGMGGLGLLFEVKRRRKK